MNFIQIEIQIIACLVAISCIIPGVFLMLRRMALITDAISHAILPGIVLGFFITHNMKSPLLILMATISGVLMVILIGYIQKTELVKEDTAIGLVFPMLFSIGVILISQYANDVHLDTDMVLLGELAFAPLDRLIINDYDLGSKSIWVMGSILILNLSLVLLFFKELKISTFDKELAKTLGFSPVIIHYGLMSMASITTVGAFDTVGAILVIAFMITPSATAYLIYKDLKKIIQLAMVIGCSSAIVGYWIAHSIDTSIAGSITTVLTAIFLGVYLFSRENGLLWNYRKEQKQQIEVSLLTLLTYLQNSNTNKHKIKELSKHFKWSTSKIKKILVLGQENKLIEIKDNELSLSEKGKVFTQQTLEYITKDNQISANKDVEDTKNNFLLFKSK